MPQQPGLTARSVNGPGAVLNVADQLGVHPARVAGVLARQRAEERAGVGVQLGELLQQLPRRGNGPSGPYRPDKLDLPPSASGRR
jgi:hypothetical protein